MDQEHSQRAGVWGEMEESIKFSVTAEAEAESHRPDTSGLGTRPGSSRSEYQRKETTIVEGLRYG